MSATEGQTVGESLLGKRSAEAAGVRDEEASAQPKKVPRVEVISRAPVRRVTQKTASLEEVGPSPRAFVPPHELLSHPALPSADPRLSLPETPVPAPTTGGAPLPEGYLEALRNRQKQPNASSSSSSSSSSAPRIVPRIVPSSISIAASAPRSSVSAPKPASEPATPAAPAPSRFVMSKAGETWEDPTLAIWDPNDYRAFCGDLGNDVDEEILRYVFCKYPSFKKARVVKDKKTGKSKGYGFISFSDPKDYIRAIKEMQGKYVGSRPIKLRQSKWKDRLKECL